MASFDIALPITLKWEGGYVDNPNDPGGETNMGITMKTFQQCSHQLLGIDPTSDNLKALTQAQAGIIYKANYWNKVQEMRTPSRSLPTSSSTFTSTRAAMPACCCRKSCGARARP